MTDPTAESETILTIVRHGETAANTGAIWHGSTDTPLSDRGHRQADSVARFLHGRERTPVAIYASPLQRARHTAEAIAGALGLEVEIETGLQEYDLGSGEGRSYKDLHEKERLWDRIKEDPNYAPHGGESPLQVVERYVDALRRIHTRHAGELVIAVGHGGALSMVFAQLIEGSYANWGLVMGNCAVTDLTLAPTPRLLSFNQTDHLSEID